MDASTHGYICDVVSYLVKHVRINVSRTLITSIRGAHFRFEHHVHGIIEEIGTVVSMQERNDLLLWNGERGTGFELVVHVKVALEGAYLGCSIAVNGTCLTATSIDEDRVAFGVAPETLRRTNLGELKAGNKVNVERSMGVDARNSGHFVQGHVDGTGAILSFTREDDSLWVKISTTPEILRDIVTKGYIAIDGTSLTVCEVDRTQAGSPSCSSHTPRTTSSCRSRRSATASTSNRTCSASTPRAPWAAYSNGWTRSRTSCSSPNA
ncbi:Lumazine-binding domain [Phytophthora cactorum]|nr:Lumazine-binding domain [Phytophthora cactorum]